MSRGRGQHAAPYTSAAELEARRAEREELRQLARELHEAAKDARDARRELRAGQAEIAKILDTTTAGHRAAFLEDLEKQSAAWSAEYSAILRDELARINDEATGQFIKNAEKCEQMMARLYQFASYTELVAAIAQSVHVTLQGRPLLLDELRETLLPPDIIVTTPDMVEEVRRADPGRVIIDGTLRALPARGCP